MSILSAVSDCPSSSWISRAMPVRSSSRAASTCAERSRSCSSSCLALDGDAGECATPAAMTARSRAWGCAGRGSRARRCRARARRSRRSGATSRRAARARGRRRGSRPRAGSVSMSSTKTGFLRNAAVPHEPARGPMRSRRSPACTPRGGAARRRDGRDAVGIEQQDRADARAASASSIARTIASSASASGAPEAIISRTLCSAACRRRSIVCVVTSSIARPTRPSGSGKPLDGQGARRVAGRFDRSTEAARGHSGRGHALEQRFDGEARLVRERPPGAACRPRARAPSARCARRPG